MLLPNICQTSVISLDNILTSWRLLVPVLGNNVVFNPSTIHLCINKIHMSIYTKWLLKLQKWACNDTVILQDKLHKLIQVLWYTIWGVLMQFIESCKSGYQNTLCNNINYKIFHFTQEKADMTFRWYNWAS